MLLLPRAVEDWVGADHPARYIREFVDCLDMGELGFEESQGTEGRPHYGRDLLLKVWLYGYLNEIRSSRKLERACREHLSLIWLTGQKEPDHNTLWRFWKRNGEGIGQLFGQVVKVAVGSGAVGMVLHALDGTKIEAVASTEGGWHRRGLERKLQELDEYIEGYVQETEAAIEEAEEREVGSYRLPEELREREQLRQRIREALGELEAEGRDHVSPQERAARMMPCGGKKKFGYNAQVVVEERNGLIVAAEVVQEETDCRQLVPMLEQAERNLGRVAEETVADKGYRSRKQLAQAREKGYSVLVQLKETEGEKAHPYHASRFVYDARQDCCICPQGERLSYEGRSWRKEQQITERSYRCHSFRECPVVQECTRDPRGRKIKLSEYDLAVWEQREKQRDASCQAQLGRRKGIVERVFAEIKFHRGLRRWSVRGLRGVRRQWALECTTYNLKKLYPLWLCGKLQFEG